MEDGIRFLFQIMKCIMYIFDIRFVEKLLKNKDGDGGWYLD